MVSSLIIGGIVGVIILIIALAGIRIVKPNERGAILFMGKYKGFASEGFNWVIPGLEQLDRIDIAQRMVNIDKQEVITKDNLNASTSMVIFYKVNEDENSVKKALYKVKNIGNQITTLAQTTARNVIGKMEFSDVNSERNTLNTEIFKIISEECKNKYGIDIVKVELKEIEPPKSVQETMNKVIMADNTKKAAIDFATAKETEADGLKRANIKEAEGIAQGKIIVAKAEAERIKLVNESASKYFKGNAQKLKELDVAQNSLQNNSKIVLGSDSKNILKLFDINKQ